MSDKVDTKETLAIYAQDLPEIVSALLAETPAEKSELKLRLIAEMDEILELLAAWRVSSKEEN